MPDKTQQQKELLEFESTSRNLRWIWIILILVTFPNVLHAKLVCIILGAAVLYNASRYVPWLMRLKLVSSPISVLIADCFFVGLIISQVGNISTPYSALLVFIVILAARLYRTRGIILSVGLQSVLLAVMAFWPISSPVMLNNPRIIVITMFALAGFGILVERLTRSDRREQSVLIALRSESEHERQRLLALVNSLNDAIFVTDSKGRIVHNNEAALLLVTQGRHMTGQKLSDAVQMRPRVNLKADPIDILDSVSSAQHRRDLSVVLDDGSTVDLDIAVMPVQLAESGKPEYIIVCEDITKERSLDEQRSEFISVASHELRTPLAIIEAALETAQMSESGMSDDIRKLIEQAHRNSALLAGIIKDITLLAEAKNDNLPIQITKIEPKAVLEGLANDFSTQIQQKGLKITVSVQPETPTVLSTERYIDEILQNYLTNAIKYSDKGTIKLSAAPSKNGGVVYSVHDEGIGISPKDQKLLFSKFFRAEDFRTRSTGGTGLGLYLCMEIAQRMGARVWCTSKPHAGSSFFLEVPEYSGLKRDQSEVVKAQVANLVDGL